MKSDNATKAIYLLLPFLLGLISASALHAQAKIVTSENLPALAISLQSNSFNTVAKLGFIHPSQVVIDFFIVSFVLAVVVIVIFVLKLLLQPRELVISFEDLRMDMNDQETNLKTMRDQAITELFAADLRKVFSIHELAISYCRQHFMNQDVAASKTCADMTNIWSQVDIRSVIIDDPAHMSIESSPFHEDLGEIKTQTALLEANIPLAALKRFMQAQKGDNIFVNGSFQDYGDTHLLVAQLRHGRNSWAWTQIQEKDQPLPFLINDLSHHVANRIMDQRSKLIHTLPGDHFKQFTDLISTFVKYLQTYIQVSTEPSLAKMNDDHTSYNQLKAKLQDFIDLEPCDLRTYYMAYIIGLLAIRREEYDDAYSFLQHAARTEPFVISAVSRAGFLLGRQKSSLDLFQRAIMLFKQISPSNRHDRVKAINLNNVIAHVNSTLGFVLERSLEQFAGDPAKQTEKLENAGRAYQRALEYDPTNPLYQSNLAEVNMKLADHQQPKDIFLEERLHFRSQAEKLLQKACQNKSKHHRNIKYAYLRMGHFCFSRADLEHAKLYYKHANQDDSDFIVAARNLATVYSIQGKYDDAIKVCNEALNAVGLKGSYSLLSGAMHGWIHNSLGWAYYLKAKTRRKQLESIKTTTRFECKTEHYLNDNECESWLGVAKLHLQEAIQLLQKYEQHAVPLINLYFVDLELACLGKLADEDMLTTGSQISSLPKDNIFSKIFHAAIEDSDGFLLFFKNLWIEHQLIPSEYIGVLGDILLFLDYFADCSIATNCQGKKALQKLHPSMTTEHGWNTIQERLEDAVVHIQELLPSCFLGLFYLWWKKPERAVNCWQSRLGKMDEDTKYLYPIGEPTPVEINSALWRYLYWGLILVFYDRSQQSPLDPVGLEKTANLLQTFENTFEKLKNIMAVGNRSLSQVAPASTIEYAGNLLAEACDIYAILIKQRPAKIRSWQEAELHKLFAPVERFNTAMFSPKRQASRLPGN